MSAEQGEAKAHGGSEGAREGYREEVELRFERQPQRSLEFHTITDTRSKDGI